MGQLCPFLADVFLTGVHRYLPVESDPDNAIVTVPQNTARDMAPEGTAGTAYLILNARAWGDVALSEQPAPKQVKSERSCRL